MDSTDQCIMMTLRQKFRKYNQHILLGCLLDYELCFHFPGYVLHKSLHVHSSFLPICNPCTNVMTKNKKTKQNWSPRQTVCTCIQAQIYDSCRRTSTKLINNVIMLTMTSCHHDLTYYGGV